MLVTTEEKVYNYLEQSANDSLTATLSVSGLFTGTRIFYLLLIFILVVKGIKNLSQQMKKDLGEK